MKPKKLDHLPSPMKKRTYYASRISTNGFRYSVFAGINPIATP
jgi:hypothetical protein